jgi:ATP-dependent 26S proteasome regulatory subunit
MGNPATTNPAQEERYLAPATSLLRENSIQQRMALFEVETPQRRLDDLIVPESTRRHIRALLTKIRYHRVLYEDFGLKCVDPRGERTAINLYGPPGTGKSFAAEAIAHELGRGLIRVNYAEIESKFVGETPKNIKAAFRKAEECVALLFFDEADSILGKRLTNISQSTDHAVNVSRSVMLLALDSFSGVAVFASNLASNYDTAFVRRILGHIAMPLPDAEARAALWRGHIPAQLPVELGQQDWTQLAADSDGLSGGDILNCVINASAAAIEREGPGCTIRLADFQAAMQSARQAQAEIGVS